MRRRSRLAAYVKEIALDILSRSLWSEGGFQAELEKRLDGILQGFTDPFTAAEEIVSDSGIEAAPEGDAV